MDTVRGVTIAAAVSGVLLLVGIGMVLLTPVGAPPTTVPPLLQSEK